MCFLFKVTAATEIYTYVHTLSLHDALPIEPFDMTGALESEDVGRETVEEEAVVADGHRAAREMLQRFLERRERFGVEVVGRLVEQQDVAAGLEHLRHMHAVPLAARKHADLLLLVGALEVEGADIGARLHLVLADAKDRKSKRLNYSQ